MSLGTILLVILILMLVGVLPSWPHSKNWGYGPSGGVSLVVVIIIAGILSGAFTATESASVAVLWALFLSALVYKKLTREQFLKCRLLR